MSPSKVAKASDEYVKKESSLREQQIWGHSKSWYSGSPPDNIVPVGCRIALDCICPVPILLSHGTAAVRLCSTTGAAGNEESDNFSCSSEVCDLEEPLGDVDHKTPASSLTPDLVRIGEPEMQDDA